MLQIGQKRLRAVMACADGDAVAREDLTDVVRVNTVHRKGDDAAMLLGLFRAQHVDVRHLADRVHRAACQRDLLLMHRCKADALDIVNGRMQAHGVCRVDRAGLELVRADGTRTIILTVAISCAGALLFPVKTQSEEAEQ